MVDAKKTKNMNLTLHIKHISMYVEEQTQFYVIWKRGKQSFKKIRVLIPQIGNKKAATKGRLIQPNLNQANIDEKFQILTVIDVDE